MLAAVVAEVVIGRLVVRGLEKKPIFVKGQAQTIVPPSWFVALDYVALFLLYFVALLGVIVLAQRVRKVSVDAVTAAAMAGAAAVAAVAEPDAVQPLLHLSLLGIAGYHVVRVWLARGDLGAAIGTSIVAAPIIVYGAASLFSGYLWTEDQMLGGEARASIGKLARNALVIAAIASPYCLSPRPFARSMTRVLPFVVALAIAGAGAVALRLDYPSTVKAVNRVLGLDLRVDAPQDQIALYLLAFATITWTTVACLTASSPARRRIGFGLALLVLAGHGFAWPASFVTAAVGIALLADGAVRVRAEERAAFVPVTPAVDDEVWHGFVGHLVASLRKLAGEPSAVSAVSVRGEGEHTSTVVVTERRGVPVRLRIERMEPGEYLRGLLDRFLTDFPEVAGVIVRIGESDGKDVHDDFRSQLVLKTPEQARAFLQEMLPVFERHGRRLIFRTWTVGAYPIGDLMWHRDTFARVFEGITSPALVVSMKYGESDFFRYLPLNRNFFRTPLAKIVELQSRREYEGCGEYPNFTGWLHERFAGLDDDPETQRMLGASLAIEQVATLRRHGLTEFHFYTLNRAELTFAICCALGLRPVSGVAR